MTQAYDAIIATITTASDASSVTKSMVKSTQWREGTSGTWLSTDCTLTAGKVSGGGTASIKFRSTGDDVDRIQATVDAYGNRTAVTLNPNDPT